MKALSVLVLVTERTSPLDWLYSHFSNELKEEGCEFEFIFAVASSQVETVRPLKPLVEAGEPIRVLEVGQVVGESSLLGAAREYAKAPILLTLPPYPRVAPGSLLALVREIENGAELATAARADKNSSWVNRTQRKLFHFFLRRTVGGRFRDVASGVRAMRREVLEEVRLYGDFSRFLPVLAERQGFHVVEIEVPQHSEDQKARVYAPGIYLRRIIDLLGLMFLVRFVQKPLRFFGLVGSGLSILGGLVLLMVILQRLGGEAVADRPMLLFGVLLVVLGVQAFAMGLIGEIIVHLAASHRRLYRVRSVEGDPAKSGEVGQAD